MDHPFALKAGQAVMIFFYGFTKKSKRRNYAPFTSRMKGNVKVARPDGGKVLTGEFTTVHERAFSYGYSQAIGRAFGTAYAPGTTVLGSATANASAYRCSVSDSRRFQGMRFIRGPHTVMQCFYMGSKRTNNGIGKCKSSERKEYDLQF
jgi:hypothetical protein